MDERCRRFYEEIQPSGGDWAGDDLGRVGDYDLIKVLDEGGFGWVVLAKNRKTGDKVVLKFPKRRRGSEEEDHERFRREAKSLKEVISHYVVELLEIENKTESPQMPYLVLKYVVGSEKLRDLSGDPVEPEVAAAIVCEAARGVADISKAGLVHRDIHPGNILVQGFSSLDNLSRANFGSVFNSEDLPRVKVIDLGQTRPMARGQGHTLTKQEMVGVPQYMAPEMLPGQGDSKAFPENSDVYSLAVILYELLVGELPVPGTWATIPDKVRQFSKFPTALPKGKEGKEIDENLQAICLRALSPRPQWRRARGGYEDAQQFADDLKRYLENKHIKAKPVGPWERLWRRVVFHPWQSAALSSIILAISVIILVLILSGQRIASERDAAQEAYSQETKALEDRDVALKKVEEAYNQKTKALRSEKKARAELTRTLYISNVRLADREWQAFRIPQFRQALENCPRGLRGWEWRYLAHRGDVGVTRLHGHRLRVNDAAFAPDGQRVATVGRVVPFDTRGTSGDLRVWDLRECRMVRRISVDAFEDLRCVAWHRDGSNLAVAGEPSTSEGDNGVVPHVALVDPDSGDTTKVLKAPAQNVNSLAFHPLGRLLATGGEGTDRPRSENKPLVRLWDVAKGALLHELPGHKHSISALAFHPAGDLLASVDVEGEIRLWDVHSGQTVPSDPWQHGGEGNVKSIAFHPQADWLLTARSDGEIKFWHLEEAKRGQILRQMLVPGAGMRDVSVSLDGRKLAIAGNDTAVRIFYLSEKRQPLVFRGHTAEIDAVCFNHDATRVVSAGKDCVVRVWDITRQQAFRTLEGKASLEWAVAAQPNGDLVAAASVTQARFADDAVRVWNARTGQTKQTLKHDDYVRTVAFSPDGALLATLTERGEVELWNVATGSSLHKFERYKKKVSSVTFVHQGTRLATSSKDGSVRILDVKDGKLVDTFSSGHEITTLASNTERGLLAVAGWEKPIQILDAESGGLLYKLGPEQYFEEQKYGPSGFVNSVTFNAAGTRLVAASEGPKDSKPGSRTAPVCVWHLSGDNPTPMHLTGHSGNVNQAVFSHGGGRVASAGQDGLLKIWDVETGRELLSLEGHAGEVKGVAFGSDDEYVVSVGEDKIVRVWDAPADQAQFFKGPEEMRFGRVHIDASEERLLAIGPLPDSIWVRTSDRHFPKEVFVWDLTRPDNPQRHSRPGAALWDAVFTDDGRLLAAGCQMDDRPNELILWNLAEPDEKPRQAMVFPTRIIDTVFSPSGRFIATCSDGGCLKVWDRQHDRVSYDRKPKDDVGVSSLVFSPDERFLAWVDERRVHTVDLTDGSEVMQVPLPTNGRPTVLAFAPDGRHLAIAVARRDVTETVLLMLDVATARPDTQLPPMSMTIRCMAFDRTGQRLFFGGRCGSYTIYRMWNVRKARQLGRIEEKSSLPPLNIAPFRDGQRFAATGRLGGVRVHELSPASLGQVPDAELTFADPQRLLRWYRDGADGCQRLEDWEGEIWYLDRLIAQSPSPNAELYGRRALARSQLAGRSQQDPERLWVLSRQDAETALRGGEVWQARFARGLDLWKHDRLVDALHELNQAIAAGGDHWRLHNWGRILLFKLARYDDSLKAFNRVVAAGVNNEAIWEKRGLVLQKLERYDESLANMTKAIKVYQKLGTVPPDLWQTRGEVHRALGHLNEAQEDFHRANPIEPRLK